MFCSDRSSTPPEQEPPFLTVRLRSPSTLSAVEGLKFGVLVQGATIASKPCKLKVWEAQTPGNICVLIENELYSY